MTAPRFDANAWAGTWPFGTGETSSLATTVAGLAGAGMAGGLVSPLRAVLAAEPSAANADLCHKAANLQQSGFTLRLAPVVDPSLADWPNQFAQANHGAGDALGAIRIVPNYHAYDLDHPGVDALADTLAARSIPLIVQIRMLDERAHHPRMVIPPVPVRSVAALAQRHPALTIVASGIFFGELAAVRDARNAYVELSSVESGDTLPDVLRTIPPERVLLGTHTPIYVPHAALAKLGGEGITSSALDAIGGETARRLFQVQGATAPQAT